MDSSSNEDSDISDSEIKDYTEKPYEQLKTGNLKVKFPNGTLRCPFCAGKKKQDYRYKDLLQHASGVSKGSANRSAKQKTTHLALTMYLKNDLANESEQTQRPVEPPSVSKAPNEDDLFVWTWMGIILNIVDATKDGLPLSDGEYWLQRYSKFKPVEAFSFWNDHSQTTEVVLIFCDDWTGFFCAMEFEKSFEVSHHGKKQWIAHKHHLGSNISGWVARKNDYDSEGPIGDFLRKNGQLKTVSDIVHASQQDRNNVVADLAIKLDTTNENLDELKIKYNEKSMSLSRMLKDKKRLHRDFVKEREKMQCLACGHIQRVLEKQQRMKYEIDCKRRELDSRKKELNKSEALTERERLRLDEEKKRNEKSNNSLERASMEQKASDANVLRLVEEQKKERQEALNKILKLQKELDAKQMLEMEIEEF